MKAAVVILHTECPTELAKFAMQSWAITIYLKKIFSASSDIQVLMSAYFKWNGSISFFV